jgi:Family of unknown function (DUF5317)
VFILYAVPIGLIAGLVLGGRLAALGELRLRLAWLALLAYVAQGVLFAPRIGAHLGGWAPALYILTNLLVLAAIVANRRVPGMSVVALGAALNLVVIVANGGYMPADRAAYERLGMTIEGYANTRFSVDPVLGLFGDWIALPAWLPGANVISVGDVVIGAGIALVLALAMRARPGGIAVPSATG